MSVEFQTGKGAGDWNEQFGLQGYGSRLIASMQQPLVRVKLRRAGGWKGTPVTMVYSKDRKKRCGNFAANS